METSSLITEEKAIRIKPEETRKIEFNEFHEKKKKLEIIAHNRWQWSVGPMPVRYKINDNNK